MVGLAVVYQGARGSRESARRPAVLMEGHQPLSGETEQAVVERGRCGVQFAAELSDNRNRVLPADQGQQDLLAAAQLLACRFHGSST